MPTDHRIVAYHQTHGHGDTFVDLSPLGASAPLTHLIVAALHIADDGTVILNDHPVDDDYHTQLWDQLDAVRSRGVRVLAMVCLLYTSPSPRDRQKSRMPSSA